MTGRTPVAGPGGNTQPGNRRNRERFARLTEVQRAAVAARAAHLYDGTRTVSRCWSEALDEVEQKARPRNEEPA